MKEYLSNRPIQRDEMTAVIEVEVVVVAMVMCVLTVEKMGILREIVPRGIGRIDVITVEAMVISLEIARILTKGGVEVVVVGVEGAIVGVDLGAEEEEDDEATHVVPVVHAVEIEDVVQVDRVVHDAHAHAHAHALALLSDHPNDQNLAHAHEANLQNHHPNDQNLALVAKVKVNPKAKAKANPNPNPNRPSDHRALVLAPPPR